MTEESNVDVDELRAELDQIKDAMGIQERYSGATSIWLLFGLAVPVAAALSQYVLLERLPQSYHAVIWLGALGAAAAVVVLRSDHPVRSEGAGAGEPRLWVQFLIVYLAAIPLQTVAHEYATGLGYVPETALSLSIILVVLGVAYGVFGASLRAYYVRKRDRYVFYVGAAWMVALALAIPQSPTLEAWGFALFGAIYFVYAIGAYVFLERGGVASA